MKQRCRVYDVVRLLLTTRTYRTLPNAFLDRTNTARCQPTWRPVLPELRDDNKELAARMRETHDLCDEYGDVATASLLEVWIDEAERRTWFLFEATRARE